MFHSFTGSARFLFTGDGRRRKIGALLLTGINEAMAREIDEHAWSFCFPQITPKFFSCVITKSPKVESGPNLMTAFVCFGPSLGGVKNNGRALGVFLLTSKPRGVIS